MTARSILVEVCAASLEDALTAKDAGADRIELNNALPLGGLTPSVGLLEVISEVAELPIIAMVRPRESGFHYSNLEFRCIQRDIDRLLEAGADGIAIGLLTDDGHVDIGRCQEIRQQSASSELVFHRAFDFANQTRDALEMLVDCGFDRLMTSGRAATAEQGCEHIAQIVEWARGRIEILPAAGISAANVVELVTKTGVDQVHGSFSSECFDNTAEGPINLTAAAGDDSAFRRTDPARLTEVMAALATL